MHGDLIRIPHPARRRRSGALRSGVPMVYIGVYLAAMLATDGIWWDWNVALGSWIWAGVCGFSLSLLILARRSA